MFCPNCGAGDQSSNSYCRRCGEWLPDKKSLSGRAAKPEERMNAMIVFNGLSAVLALFSAIALYATYLDTPEAKWSVYVAGAFCMVIAIHQTLGFAFALELRLRRKGGSAGAKQAIGLEAGGGVVSLGSRETTQPISVPSVTENTTELLDEAPRVRESSNSQRR